jgi:hypothetical protein
LHFLPHFALHQCLGTNERILIQNFFLHTRERQPYLDSDAVNRNKRYVNMLFVAAEFLLQRVFPLDSDCLRHNVTEIIWITGRLKVFEACIHAQLPSNEINEVYFCRWFQVMKLNFKARRDPLYQLDLFYPAGSQNLVEVSVV